MTTRQRRGSGRVARRRPSARKRGFRVKGWKAFLFSFACRRCTLFSLKNPLSRTRWQKKTLGLFVSSILPLPPFLSFFRVFLSFLSLFLLLAFILRGLLAFSSTAASSSTRASVRGNRSRETRFSRREIAALRLARCLPPITLLVELSCSLNILIRRTKTKKSPGAKVGQGSPLVIVSLLFFSCCFAMQQCNARMMLQCFREFLSRVFLCWRATSREIS